MKRRIVFITVHHWNSKRKAGFHWLAEAFNRKGYDVLFMTCSLSYISAIRRDKRLDDSLYEKRNQLIQERDGIWSYIWFTPWHPSNLRLNVFNRIASFFFRKYSLFSLGESESFIRSADIIIIESCAAVMLYQRLKRINPDARFVYRVSDDLRLLKSHSTIIEAERRFASEFDLVSVPNANMLKLFNEETTNLQLHPHGINKDLLDAEYVNPYTNSAGKNAVFIGIAYFDLDFIERASRQFPEVNFHIIGPISGLPDRPNVIAYGEIDYQETLPYVKHADIGLHTLFYRPGSESLGDSLKVIQYTYLGLPIIAPDFITSSRPNMFFYCHGDDNSIFEAIRDSLKFDQSRVDRDGARSWDELADVLEGDKDE
jgi:2-beta-glucuronyltransferase